MQRTLIISLLMVHALIAFGCGNSDNQKPTPDTDTEPQLIYDRYGFSIMDIDGFTEDKATSSLAWNILTFRSENTRIQFGYIKGAKVMSDIPGIPAPTENQLMYDWAMGMLSAPKFYPGSTKSILLNDYVKVDGRNAMVIDILLELDKDELENLPDAVFKTNGEELKFLQKNNICVLQIYLIFRGRDMFHVEIFSDPLTYLSTQPRFKESIIDGLRFKDLPTKKAQ